MRSNTLSRYFFSLLCLLIASNDWAIAAQPAYPDQTPSSDSKPLISSPKSGSTGIPLMPTLAWTPDPKATSYKVEVAQDKAFLRLAYVESVPVPGPRANTVKI